MENEENEENLDMRIVSKILIELKLFSESIFSYKEKID
jgi:hypothetical protein